MNGLPDFSRRQVWRSFGMVMPAALCFTLTADLPHVFLITLMLYIFVLCWPRAWVISDRSVVYSILTAMILTVVEDYFIPLMPGRFGFMSFFSRPELLAPLLFYLAALISGFRRRSGMLFTAVAAMIFAYTAGSDAKLEFIENSRLPEFDLMPQHFHRIYFSLLGISVVALICSTSRVAPSRIRFGRLAVLSATMLLAATLTVIQIREYHRHRQFFRNLENALLQIGMNRDYDKNRLQERSSNLNEPLKWNDSPDTVVVRVTSDTAPGYLRRDVFTRYRRGIWSSPSASSPKTLENVSPPQRLVVDQLFAITRPEKTSRQMVVYPTSALRSQALMLPGDCVSLELIADEVQREIDGQILPKKFIREGGYTAFVDKFRQQTAPDTPKLVPPFPRTYLSSSGMGIIMHEISLELKLQNAINDRERFKRLLRYFELNFEYSADWAGSTDTRDPVEVFLTDRRRGHCEVYATAMIMLLRHNGIPSRYISGIVVDEPHPGGRYFLGRRRDLHAWVEAYDRDELRWVMLDPTPESLRRPDTEDSLVRKLYITGDGMLLFFQKFTAQLRRGHIFSFGMDLLAELRRWTATMLFNPSGAVFATVLATILYLTCRRKKDKNDRCTPARRKLRSEFFRRCRRWKRRGWIAAKENPSAAELLEHFSIASNIPESGRLEAVAFLTRYLRRRFGAGEETQ